MSKVFLVVSCMHKNAYLVLCFYFKNANINSATSGRLQGEPNNDYRLVVFGSAGVGKSSLVLRFVKGTFKESYVPTIEDTYRHLIACNKQVCTLQITDTTGSHQFPAMQRLNIQRGHAFILVYSITSRQSLEELKAIFKDIHDIKGDDIKNVPMMLVGSKCDETSHRDVPTAYANKLAQEWHCAFMETSAKTNVNVKEAFQELLKLDTRNNLSLNVHENLSSNSLNGNTTSVNNSNNKLNKKNDKKANKKTKAATATSTSSATTTSETGANQTSLSSKNQSNHKKCLIS